MAVDGVSLDRHSQRDKVIMPITLVAISEGERVLVPALTLDFSSDGLRIQAHVRLTVGEVIRIRFDKESTDLGHYKVVWATATGGLRPGQAGLRSLQSIDGTMAEPLAMSGSEPGISAA